MVGTLQGAYDTLTGIGDVAMICSLKKKDLIRQEKVVQIALLCCLNVLYLSLTKERRMIDLKIQ